jgi:hypothetical protein
MMEILDRHFAKKCLGNVILILLQQVLFWDFGFQVWYKDSPYLYSNNPSHLFKLTFNNFFVI